LRATQLPTVHRVVMAALVERGFRPRQCPQHRIDISFGGFGPTLALHRFELVADPALGQAGFGGDVRRAGTCEMLAQQCLPHLRGPVRLTLLSGHGTYWLLNRVGRISFCDF
jgi:hypothetical protein